MGYLWSLHKHVVHFHMKHANLILCAVQLWNKTFSMTCSVCHLSLCMACSASTVNFKWGLTPGQIFFCQNFLFSPSPIECGLRPLGAGPRYDHNLFPPSAHNHHSMWGKLPRKKTHFTPLFTPRGWRMIKKLVENCGAMMVREGLITR